MPTAGSAAGPDVAALLLGAQSTAWKERRDAVAQLCQAVRGEEDVARPIAQKACYALSRLIEDKNVLVTEQALELAVEVGSRLSVFPTLDALLSLLLSNGVTAARLSNAQKALRALSLFATHDMLCIQAFVKNLENALTTKAPKSLLQMLDAACCVVEDAFDVFSKNVYGRVQDQQGGTSTSTSNSNSNGNTNGNGNGATSTRKQVPFSPTAFIPLIASTTAQFSNKNAQIRAAAVDLAALLSGHSANFAGEHEDKLGLDAAAQMDAAFREALPKNLEAEYDEVSISLVQHHKNAFRIQEPTESVSFIPKDNKLVPSPNIPPRGKDTTGSGLASAESKTLPRKANMNKIVENTSKSITSTRTKIEEQRGSQRANPRSRSTASTYESTSHIPSINGNTSNANSKSSGSLDTTGTPKPTQSSIPLPAPSKYSSKTLQKPLKRKKTSVRTVETALTKDTDSLLQTQPISQRSWEDMDTQHAPASTRNVNSSLATHSQTYRHAQHQEKQQSPVSFNSPRIEIRSPYLFPLLDHERCMADTDWNVNTDLRIFGLSPEQEVACAKCMNYLIDYSNTSIEETLRICIDNPDVTLLLSTAGASPNDYREEIATIAHGIRGVQARAADVTELDKIITYLIVSITTLQTPFQDGDSVQQEEKLLHFLTIFLSFTVTLILSYPRDMNEITLPTATMLKILEFLVNANVSPEEEFQRAATIFFLFVLNKSVLGNAHGIKEIANIVIHLLLEGTNDPEAMVTKRKALSPTGDNGTRKQQLTHKQANGLLNTMNVSNVRVLREVFQMLCKYYRMDRGILKLMLSDRIVSNEVDIQQLIDGVQDTSNAQSKQQEAFNKAIIHHLFFNHLNDNDDEHVDENVVLPELLVVRIEDCIAIEQILDSSKTTQGASGRMTNQAQVNRMRSINEAYLGELCEFILDIETLVGADVYYPLLSPYGCNPIRREEVQRLIVDFMNRAISSKENVKGVQLIEFGQEKSDGLTSLHDYLISSSPTLSSSKHKDPNSSKLHYNSFSFPTLPVREMMEYIVSVCLESEQAESFGDADGIFSHLPIEKFRMIQGMVCTNQDDITSLLGLALDLVQTNATTDSVSSEVIKSYSDILELTLRFEKNLQSIYQTLLKIETEERYKCILALSDLASMNNIGGFLLSLLSTALMFVSSVNTHIFSTMNEDEVLFNVSGSLISILRMSCNIIPFLSPLLSGARKDVSESNDESDVYSMIMRAYACISQLMTTPVSFQTQRTGVEGVHYNLTILSLFIKLYNGRISEINKTEDNCANISCYDAMFNGNDSTSVYNILTYKQYTSREIDNVRALIGTYISSNDTNKLSEEMLQVISARLMEDCPLFPLFDELDGHHRSRMVSAYQISLLGSMSLSLISQISTLPDLISSYRIGKDALRSLLKDKSLVKQTGTFNVSHQGQRIRATVDQLIGTLISIYNMLLIVHEYIREESMKRGIGSTKKAMNSVQDEKTLENYAMSLTTTASALCISISLSEDQNQIEQIRALLDSLKQGNNEGNNTQKQRLDNALIDSMLAKEETTIDDVRTLSKICLEQILDVGKCFTHDGRRGFFACFIQELLRRVTNIRRKRREEYSNTAIQNENISVTLQGEAYVNNTVGVTPPESFISRPKIMHSPQPSAQAYLEQQQQWQQQQQQQQYKTQTPSKLGTPLITQSPERLEFVIEDDVGTLEPPATEKYTPRSAVKETPKRNILRSDAPPSPSPTPIPTTSNDVTSPGTSKTLKKTKKTSSQRLSQKELEIPVLYNMESIQSLPIHLSTSSLISSPGTSTINVSEKDTEIGIQLVCDLISHSFLTPPSCLVWNMCKRILSEETTLQNQRDDSFTDSEEAVNYNVPQHVVQALLPKPTAASMIPSVCAQQTNFIGTPESAGLSIAPLRALIMRLQMEEDNLEAFARVYSGFCLSLAPLIYSVSGNKEVINTILDLTSDVAEILTSLCGSDSTHHRRLSHRLLHALVSSLTNLRCNCDELPGIKTQSAADLIKQRIDDILTSMLNADGSDEYLSTAADFTGPVHSPIQQHVLRWITGAINEGLSPVTPEEKWISMSAVGEEMSISEENRRCMLTYISEKSKEANCDKNGQHPHFSLSACFSALDFLNLLLDITDDDNIVSGVSDVLMRVLVAYTSQGKEPRGKKKSFEAFLKEAKKLSKRVSDTMNRMHSRSSITDLPKTPLNLSQHVQTHTRNKSFGVSALTSSKRDTEVIVEVEEEQRQGTPDDINNHFPEDAPKWAKVENEDRMLTFSPQLEAEPNMDKQSDEQSQMQLEELQPLQLESRKQDESECIIVLLESSLGLLSNLGSISELEAWSEHVVQNMKTVINYIQKLDGEGTDIDTYHYILQDSVEVPMSVVLMRCTTKVFNVCAPLNTNENAVKVVKYFLRMCTTLMNVSHLPISSHEYASLLVSIYMHYKNFENDTPISKMFESAALALTTHDMLLPCGYVRGSSHVKKEIPLPPKYEGLLAPLEDRIPLKTPPTSSRLATIIWILYGFTCLILSALYKMNMLGGNNVDLYTTDISLNMLFVISEQVAGAVQRYFTPSTSDYEQAAVISGGSAGDDIDSMLWEWNLLKARLQRLAANRKDLLLTTLASQNHSLISASKKSPEEQGCIEALLSNAQQVPNDALGAESYYLLENQNWTIMMSKLCELENIHRATTNTTNSYRQHTHHRRSSTSSSFLIPEEKICMLNFFSETNKALIAFQSALRNVTFVYNDRAVPVSSLNDHIIIHGADDNIPTEITVSTLKCNFRHTKKYCSVITSQLQNQLIFLLCAPGFLAPIYPAGCVSLVLILLKNLAQDITVPEDIRKAIESLWQV